MQVTHKDLMTQIALTGWAMVFGARQEKAAQELEETGLFTLTPHIVGGVECKMLKLK